MTSPIRLWICATYQPVHRCGGWAAVRAGQGPVFGIAGGERHTTASRTALLGLAAGLRDLPPADAIDILTTSPELAGFTRLIASLGEPTQAAGPDEDLDLWAQIATAARGRRLSLVRTPLDPGAPIAFAAAWADLARDKAKASGAFTAAIPKPNLAKMPGLDLR
jgi:hypothetical protein